MPAATRVNAAGPDHDKVKPVVPLKALPFRSGGRPPAARPVPARDGARPEYLLALDVDRLLHTFRVNAGLAFSAKPLGGWEEPKVELRGHFTGHYLSACALMYRQHGRRSGSRTRATRWWPAWPSARASWAAAI